jgi:hypothetical protein
MDVDVSNNVVVFRFDAQGRAETRTGHGPARAADCIRQVWAGLCAKEPLNPMAVRHIYTEWEPSDEDKAFLDANFPQDCQVNFSFHRPTSEEGWAQAMKQAEEQMRQALAKKTLDDASAKSKGRLDDLMPVLRNIDGFSEMVVNCPVGPGIGFYLAHVNWTERKTIGTLYVMKRDVETTGKTAEELMTTALRNFASGLQVQGAQAEGERVFMVKHSLDMGASAIGLPDFHSNASRWAGSAELFVGYPDPSVLFVTAMSNTRAVTRMTEAIITSDYWGAVALTPACYRLTAGGLELIAARTTEPKAEG